MRIPHGLRSALASQTAASPTFDDVSLLLYGDGTNGSTAIVDSSANTHTITVNGDAQISTTQSKFGGASMNFDGSGDYLTAPVDSSFEFGTGDFTVECWLYLTNNTGTQPIILLGNGASGGPSTISYSAWYLFYLSGTGLRFYQYNGTETFYTFSTTLSTNTWYHIAVSRSGASLRCFVDGTQVGSTATTSLSYNRINNDNLHIGRVLSGSNSSTIYYLNGYLDDLRITKGVARYTANFTPPAAGFSTLTPAEPYFYNNSLLLHGDGTNGSTTFTDDSNNSHTISVFGDAQIATAQSKFGGASMYFDGVGDYITAPSDSSFDFGTGDFTIEFWMRPSNVSGTWQAIISRKYNQSGGWRLYKTSGTNNLSFYHPSGYYQTTNSGLANGTWHHIAVVRSGSTLTTYVDGTSRGTDTISLAMSPTSADIEIGQGVVTSAYPYQGYLDDLRITKGVARYTANFTPPTSAFPDL